MQMEALASLLIKLQVVTFADQNTNGELKHSSGKH